MPDLEASIWQTYKEKGVLVYGVHQGEDAKLLGDFVKQTGVTFPIVEDTESTLFTLDFPPGVGYPYPRDVVIDKNLKIRFISNSFEAEEMGELVERLLAE